MAGTLLKKSVINRRSVRTRLRDSVLRNGVLRPASSTLNAVARWGDTAGKSLLNSTLVVGTDPGANDTLAIFVGSNTSGIIWWEGDVGQDYFNIQDDVLFEEEARFGAATENISGAGGVLTLAAATKVTVESSIEAQKTVVYDAEVDNGNSGAADTIDWRLGNKQKSTLTGNCTYTFTAPPGACNLVFKLVQDGTGSRTVTWPATTKWIGGDEPALSTAAAAIDIVTFYYDGTSYHGAIMNNFS